MLLRKYKSGIEMSGSSGGGKTYEPPCQKYNKKTIRSMSLLGWKRPGMGGRETGDGHPERPMVRRSDAEMKVNHRTPNRKDILWGVLQQVAAGVNTQDG